MIKSTDVRRGNYAEYDGRVFRIDTIADEFPTLDTIEFGIGVVSWEGIKPIPLTEQWLLDFGFSNETLNDSDNGEYYAFTKESICVYNSEYDSDFYFDYADSEITKIEYVHQLQNLYCVLTGQELICNPTAQPKN